MLSMAGVMQIYAFVRDSWCMNITWPFLVRQKESVVYERRQGAHTNCLFDFCRYKKVVVRYLLSRSSSSSKTLWRGFLHWATRFRSEIWQASLLYNGAVLGEENC